MATTHGLLLSEDGDVQIGKNDSTTGLTGFSNMYRNVVLRANAQDVTAAQPASTTSGDICVYAINDFNPNVAPQLLTKDSPWLHRAGSATASDIGGVRRVEFTVDMVTSNQDSLRTFVNALSYITAPASSGYQELAWQHNGRCYWMRGRYRHFGAVDMKRAGMGIVRYKIRFEALDPVIYECEEVSATASVGQVNVARPLTHPLTIPAVFVGANRGYVFEGTAPPLLALSFTGRGSPIWYMEHPASGRVEVLGSDLALTNTNGTWSFHWEDRSAVAPNVDNGLPYLTIGSSWWDIQPWEEYNIQAFPDQSGISGFGVTTLTYHRGWWQAI